MSKDKVTLSIVEKATRQWLSAQVLIACIMLALLALSISDARDSLEEFPLVFQTTCIQATYSVEDGIIDAMVSVVDSVQTTTNDQYRKSVRAARTVITGTMEISVDVFKVLLKQINKIVYCGVDTGLGLVSDAKNALENMKTIRIHCEELGELCDIAKDIVNEFNKVIRAIRNLVSSWPDIPSSLTEVLDDALEDGGFNDFMTRLALFDAPETILKLNASKLVLDAMADLQAFDDAAETCVDISIGFEKASKHTRKVMYWIEVTVWLLIALLIIGIFVVSILRQYPTKCVDMLGSAAAAVSHKIEDKIDSMGDRMDSEQQDYFKWFMKYIRFRPALVTSMYGIMGIFAIYLLTSLTGSITDDIHIWVNHTLTPSMDKVQNQLQDGINEALSSFGGQFLREVQFVSEGTVGEVKDTLDDIVNTKNKYLNVVEDIFSKIASVPVVGAPIAEVILCTFPFNSLNLIDSAANTLVDFLKDLLSIRPQFPFYTFPSLAGTATKATFIAVEQMTDSVEKEMRRYRIIFIFLSIAAGVLVLQGVLIIILKKISYKISQRWNKNK